MGLEVANITGMVDTRVVTNKEVITTITTDTHMRWSTYKPETTGEDVSSVGRRGIAVGSVTMETQSSVGVAQAMAISRRTVATRRLARRSVPCLSV